MKINIVINKVIEMVGKIFFRVSNLLFFPQDNNGPTPMTKIAGAIIGITVEL